jgi:hypothetical protein
MGIFEQRTVAPLAPLAMPEEASIREGGKAFGPYSSLSFQISGLKKAFPEIPPFPLLIKRRRAFRLGLI